MPSKEENLKIVQTTEPGLQAYLRCVKEAGAHNSRVAAERQASSAISSKEPTSIEVRTKEELERAIDAKADEIVILDVEVGSDVQKAKKLKKKLLAGAAGVAVAAIGYAAYKYSTGGDGGAGFDGALILRSHPEDIDPEQASELLKWAGIGLIGFVVSLAIMKNYDVEVSTQYESPTGHKFNNTTILRRKKK